MIRAPPTRPIRSRSPVAFWGTSRAGSTGIPVSTFQSSFEDRGSCSRSSAWPTRHQGRSPFGIARPGGSFVRQGKRFRFCGKRVSHALCVSSPASDWPAGSGTVSLLRSAGISRPLRMCRRNTPGQSDGPGPDVPAQERRHPDLEPSGLSQTFEAKAKTAAGDTAAATDARKFRVLSINTSSITYDFEQAKKPGRTGWVTPSITNSLPE